MRQVNIGNYTKVLCGQTDREPFNYLVVDACANDEAWVAFADIYFQKGPLKEVEVNGCRDEDLLAIVIDRLKYFQEGKYRCRENALALTKLEEALHWLEHRTRDRIRRGVEGTGKE